MEKTAQGTRGQIYAQGKTKDHTIRINLVDNTIRISITNLNNRAKTEGVYEFADFS